MSKKTNGKTWRSCLWVNGLLGELLWRTEDEIS
jgi:hypothetical protein